MRDIVELFKLIKANKQLMVYGLCGIVKNMKLSDIITEEEAQLLSDYIRENRPVKGSEYCDDNRIDDIWFWEPGKWPPRELWINAQISKLSKND